MATILINYDVFNIQIDALDQSIEDFLLEMEDIHTASENVHGTWEGSSKDASQTACNSLLLYLRDTIENLSRMRNSLAGAKEDFQNAETELSKAFDVKISHVEGE